MALEDYKKDMMRCVRCSVCKFIPLSSIIKSWRFAYGCPSSMHKNFHAYSGGGKLILALSFLEGRIGYSPKLLEVIYNCSLCGMCDLACKIGTDLEVWEILHEFRKRCFKDGQAPLSGHKPILDSLKNYDNVWMQPRARRGDWAKGIKVKDARKEKVSVLYFAGCTYSYDPNLKEIARKTLSILLQSGVDVGILGNEEKCCSSPAYMIGDEETFKKYGEENIERFNELGIEVLLTSCAGCYGLFKSKYPRLGKKMNFKVMHSVEYIWNLINEGRIKPRKSIPLTVTYHDPCHLGRLSEPRIPSHGKERYELNTLPIKEVPKVLGLNGVYDPPREILRSIPGVKFVEMERRREYSFCCGSGAGARSAFPEFAEMTALERLEEAHSTGANALVTACPWCEKNFMDANQKFNRDLKVVDIIELLYSSMGG
jgi:Fe-S oxidoreductase